MNDTYARLEFEGPYASTTASPLLLFGNAPSAHKEGLYLQVVQLGHNYRVAYVGESGRSFVSRIKNENRKWLSGTDRRSGQVMELDNTQYRHGVRAYRAASIVEGRRMRQDALDSTLLFLAPMSIEKSIRRSVENALMRRLKSCPDEVSDFLYNCPKPGLFFDGRLEIAVPAGVVIQGLSGWIPGYSQSH